MLHYGLTNVGRVREHNEDALTAATLQWGGDVFIVSDGVGGHAGGEVASRIVVETLPLLLEERLEALGPAPTMEAVQDVLGEAIASLCRKVEQQARDMAGVRGLAATVVCGLVAADTLVLGHLGDSRAYLLRDGRLQLLTSDHTVAQILLDLGEIGPEEFKDHPARGRLTQAVGMEQEPAPSLRHLQLHQGDRVLLCSDGLHGMVDDEAIARALQEAAGPEAACSQLVELALEGGGKDNVTALVFQA